MAANKHQTTILIGAQWGDEGKGKIIDLLTEKSDYIVRYQGGNNAGHTVCFGNQKFILHLLPSGILHRGKICIIGNGVVIDLEAFFNEIEMLRKNRISVHNRLFVSDRAHVIFPYHRLLDELREEKERGKIGTTKRGIGPCYGDKANRLGIRVVDLLNPQYFKNRLKLVLDEKNEMLSRIYNHKPFSFNEIYRRYVLLGKKVAPFVRNTGILLDQAYKQRKRILFEGAQGTHLDVDHGTYPYVTSSNATAGGAITGAGLGPAYIDTVLGVVKAYTTRVGEGPFPTEFPPDLMKTIQARGEEFGATTGRPRRCGWFDAVLTKHSVLVNGLRSIAVTKLDVLSGLEKIKICVAYEYRGRRYRDFPADADALKNAKPVYEEHPGWDEAVTDVKSFSKLPKNAKSYLKRLEQLMGVPIEIVSIGSKRSETIFLHDKRSISKY